MKGIAAKKSFSDRFIQAVDSIKKGRLQGMRYDADVAKALGIFPQQLNKIRKGGLSAPIEAMETLAERFNVNPAFLLKGDKPMFMEATGTTDEAIRERLVDIVENELAFRSGKAVSKLFTKPEIISYSAYQEYKFGRTKRVSNRLRQYLTETFQINWRYIETGEGGKFLYEDPSQFKPPPGVLPKPDKIILPNPEHHLQGVPEVKEFAPRVITVTPDNEDIMVVVPQKAAAHYFKGWSDPEFADQLPKMHLPEMPTGRTTRAFQVDGDSMLPHFHNGSYVACTMVDNIEYIKEGYIHIVISDEFGITLKRVYRRGPNLRLVSDNPLFIPFEIPVKSVDEIWVVNQGVVSQFPPPTDLGAKVNHLQVDLLQFKSEVKDEIRETADMVKQIALKIGI